MWVVSVAAEVELERERVRIAAGNWTDHWSSSRPRDLAEDRGRDGALGRDPLLPRQTKEGLIPPTQTSSRGLWVLPNTTSESANSFPLAWPASKDSPPLPRLADDPPFYPSIFRQGLRYLAKCRIIAGKYDVKRGGVATVHHAPIVRFGFSKLCPFHLLSHPHKVPRIP